MLALSLAIGGRPQAQPVRAGGPRRDGGQRHDRLGGHRRLADGHRRGGDGPHVGRNCSGVYEESIKCQRITVATKELFQQGIRDRCALVGLEKFETYQVYANLGRRPLVEPWP